jgi:hypothetical protein
MAEQRIIDRVAAMLAIAEHPNTPPHEAEVALRQANSLMLKHAIDQATARASQSAGERTAPTRLRIAVSGGTSGFGPMLSTIAFWVARTNRCEAVVVGTQRVEIFGTADDAAWVEMLYTQIHMEFLGRIAPKWEPGRSYGANVYVHKVAGYKWNDINSLSISHGGPDARQWIGGKMKIASSMISAYKREAKRRGDSVLVTTQSFGAYREQFARAFQARVIARLQDQETQNEMAADSIPGAAMALSSQIQANKEALWEAWPEMHPDFRAEQRREMERLAREAAEREAEERARLLRSMTPTQRNLFLEKEEREQRRKANADDRYWRDRLSKLDSTAHKLGAAAASEINLSRHGGKVRNSAPRTSVEG